MGAVSVRGGARVVVRWWRGGGVLDVLGEGRVEVWWPGSSCLYARLGECVRFRAPGSRHEPVVHGRRLYRMQKSMCHW